MERFNNQAGQLRLAIQADEVADRRYRTSIETFLIGKISTLDLNDAQVSRDEAHRKRIQEVYYYWSYFYQLRSVSLWDFQTNAPIDGDMEAVLRDR